GLGGIPSPGQRSTAAVKASATASSATPMSPKTRTSTATARPYSARNTRSISVARAGSKPVSVLSAALERPHLDRQREDLRRLARPAECFIQIGRAHDPEPSDVLLALDVGSVGHHDAVAPRPQHRG